MKIKGQIKHTINIKIDMSILSKKNLMFAPLMLLLACGNNQPASQQSAAPASGQNTASNTTAQASHSQGASLPEQGHEPAASIPDFGFYILKSGISFSKSDLRAGDRQVFILFDPSCSFCQHEAAFIAKNFGKFANTNFYFISMNDPGLMSTFFDRFAKELNDKPNVFMLYDRNVDFVNKFHVPTQFPATYVYDGNGLLKTYWNGVKSEEDMVQSILN